MAKQQPIQNRMFQNREPGANSRLLELALAGFSKKKVNMKDPEAISERIQEYLQFCMEKDMRPQVENCCLWLGIDKRSLEEYYTGAKGSPEVQQVLIQFYNVIKSVWADQMSNSDVNPVAGIYMSKVYFGYKDTQEIVVRNADSSNRLTAEELINASRLLPGSDTLALTEGTETVED